MLHEHVKKYREYFAKNVKIIIIYSIELGKKNSFLRDKNVPHLAFIGKKTHHVCLMDMSLVGHFLDHLICNIPYGITFSLFYLESFDINELFFYFEAKRLHFSDINFNEFDYWIWEITTRPKYGYT